ncbi:MAG: 50S ribosomal protein L29 [Spirochaetia bacterium]|nr:50S ribosomal protein L29 [Spirochaetia bacterium]
MAIKGKTKGELKKSSSFHEMTDKELEKILVDSKKELQEARFKTATSGFTNFSKFKSLKKNIARILTVQRLRLIKEKAQVSESN